MVISQRLRPRENQFKYLSYLNGLVFLGYLILTFSYLFRFAEQDILQNPVVTAREFTPVLIVGMCYLVLSFTCGEFFGLLRYQFQISNDEPGAKGLRRVATRSLSVFFMCIICFYFLRAGFQENLLEKIFFVLMPSILGIYLIFILRQLKAVHVMAPWYYRLKLILLGSCAIGQFIANIVLFFPDFIATIPPRIYM